MKPPKTIFCVGANHKSAEIEVRESLFLRVETILRVLPEFIHATNCAEALVISTCNRLELIGVLEREAEQDEIYQIFFELQRRGHAPKRALSEESIRGNSYCFTGVRAVEHVFSVASGLDSLVVGETQIIGQFKDAAQMAKEMGTLGPVLDRLTQDALNTTGRVRTKTDIGRGTVSIAHAAVDLANRVYGGFDRHNILIIGAGEMSSVAARYAVQYSPRQIMVVNRTPSRAQKVIETAGMGQAYGWEDLDMVLQLADIVISSTAKDGFVIDKPMLQKAQKARKSRPIFLIDIALPRDIDPECAELENVYIFDIDDLKQVVAEGIEERSLAAERALGMVTDSALNYWRWYEHLELKPALHRFRSYLDDLIDREVQRSFSKGSLRELTDVQRSSIAELMRSVASKISSDAGSNVLAPPEGFYKEQLAASLSVLFPAPKAKEK